MPTLATRYREAYAIMQPETVGAYFDMLQSIDPNGKMAERNGQVYIEFSDGSEWRLGAFNTDADKMGKHDTN
jgi:hypothetical protein